MEFRGSESVIARHRINLTVAYAMNYTVREGEGEGEGELELINNNRVESRE